MTCSELANVKMVHLLEKSQFHQLKVARYAVLSILNRVKMYLSYLLCSKHAPFKARVDFTSLTKRIKFVPFMRKLMLQIAKNTLDLLIRPTNLVKKKKSLIVNKCKIIDHS